MKRREKLKRCRSDYHVLMAVYWSFDDQTESWSHFDAAEGLIIL